LKLVFDLNRGFPVLSSGMAVEGLPEPLGAETVPIAVLQAYTETRFFSN
jgi:hypothetical protein